MNADSLTDRSAAQTATPPDDGPLFAAASRKADSAAEARTGSPASSAAPRLSLLRYVDQVDERPACPAPADVADDDEVLLTDGPAARADSSSEDYAWLRLDDENDDGPGAAPDDAGRRESFAPDRPGGSTAVSAPQPDKDEFYFACEAQDPAAALPGASPAAAADESAGNAPDTTPSGKPMPTLPPAGEIARIGLRPRSTLGDDGTFRAGAAGSASTALPPRRIGAGKLVPTRLAWKPGDPFGGGTAPPPGRFRWEIMLTAAGVTAACGMACIWLLRAVFA